MIQWYPGHMAKAKREMVQTLSLADVAIEVLDARAPEATRNPDLAQMFQNKPRVVVLNKEDLASPAITKQWLSHYRAQGALALAYCATRSGKNAPLFDAVQTAAAKVVERWAQRGAVKPVRVMVAGIPNVGKSSLINCLSGGKRAKVGATPGVTRGKQWVRLSQRLELMDTPGILWPKLEDQQAAARLAMINAIRDEILEREELALALIGELNRMAPQAIEKRYQVQTQDLEPLEVLLAIGKRRGFVVRGGEIDTERAANTLIDEFRQGKLGRISLEAPQAQKEE